jgi:hypothetical protein
VKAQAEARRRASILTFISGGGLSFQYPVAWHATVANAMNMMGITIVPARGERLEGMRQLVVDFQRVTVGIDEVEAALIDVVGGAQDLDAIADKVGRRHAKPHSCRPGRRCAQARSGRVAGAAPFQVLDAGRCRGVEVVAQRHEHAPVLRSSSVMTKPSTSR